MESKTVANHFSLVEDALLMSIVKRWTNVVYEDNSDVVTKTEKMKAWKKIEQTFNNLTVDGNKGYRTAEVLRVRSEHLERLKNRRGLIQNLASGEGNSITEQGSDDAVVKLSASVEGPKPKHERKDDGDGNMSTDEQFPLTETPKNDLGKESGNELRADMVQLLRLREKLMRKEIKIRIEHSKLLFEKEMEILEIKKKNLLPILMRSAARIKAKRKTINRGDECRLKPQWGQSLPSLKEGASKKKQSKMVKTLRKKVGKTECVQGAGRKKRTGAWGRLDDGTTDNEDLASQTDEDRQVKLVLEQLTTRNDTEAEETDIDISNADTSEIIGKMNQEYKLEGKTSLPLDSHVPSDALLPTKLANIIEKILKQDSTDEIGKRARIEKE